MTDFATRAVQAATSAVDKRARLLCEATEVLAAKPKQQYALAALAAGFRLAASERLSPEELSAAEDQFEAWLAAAAKPAKARGLRVVPERKAS